MDIIVTVLGDMSDFLLILFLSIAMFTILFSRFTYVAGRFGDQTEIEVELEDENTNETEPTIFEDFKASFNLAILGDFELL